MKLGKRIDYGPEKNKLVKFWKAVGVQGYRCHNYGIGVVVRELSTL